MDSAERLETVALVEDVLEHHGIKGMKWGVRRNLGGRKGSSKESKEAPKKATAEDNEGKPTRSSDGRIKVAPKSNGQVEAKPKGQDLSDAELRTAINRIRMEREYAELTKAPPSKGDKAKEFVQEILLDVGKKQTKNLLNSLIGGQITKAFGPPGKDSAKETSTESPKKPEPVDIGEIKVNNPAAGKKPIRVIEMKPSTMSTKASTTRKRRKK